MTDMSVDYVWDLRELEEERKDLFKQLFPHLWRELKPVFTREKTRIVDVGCGTEYLGRLIVKNSGKKTEVLGMDIDGKLLRGAKKLVKEEDLSDYVFFAKADAYDLPIPDNSVDIVLFVTLLINVDRPGKVVEEAMRVTKHNGYVFAVESDFTRDKAYFPYDSRLRELHEKSGEALRKGWKIHGGSPDVARKLPSIFERAGLYDVKTVECEYEYSWVIKGDEEEIKGLLDSLKKGQAKIMKMLVDGGMSEEEIDEYTERASKLYERLIILRPSERKKYIPKFKVPFFIVHGIKRES